MSYYYGVPRGDYYRGDYYRGDPGFFSFIGKAIKGIAGSVLGGGFGGGGGAAPAQQAITIPGLTAKPSTILQKVGPIVTALKKPSRLTKLGAITAIGGAAA